MQNEVDIYGILTKKLKALQSIGDPLAVDFTLQEINILSDLTQLRLLKLKTPFPVDYEPAKDIFDCVEKILRDSDIYRVLEYCIWKNRVLIPNVTKVFEKLKRG